LSRFEKGISGNPKGRPKKGHSLTELLEKALQKKREEGIKGMEPLADALLDLALKQKNIAAIKYCYDRIDGKPTETIQLMENALDSKLEEILNG